MSISDSPGVPGRVTYGSRNDLIADLNLHALKMVQDYKEHHRAEPLSDAAWEVWIARMQDDARRRAVDYFRYEHITVNGIERKFLAELLWEVFQHVFNELQGKDEAEYVGDR